MPEFFAATKAFARFHNGDKPNAPADADFWAEVEANPDRTSIN